MGEREPNKGVEEEISRQGTGNLPRPRGHHQLGSFEEHSKKASVIRREGEMSDRVGPLGLCQGFS